MNYNNIDGDFGVALRDATLGEPPDDFRELDDDKLDVMLRCLAREFGDEAFEEEEESIVDMDHPDEGWLYNDKY